MLSVVCDWELSNLYHANINIVIKCSSYKKSSKIRFDPMEKIRHCCCTVKKTHTVFATFFTNVQHTLNDIKIAECQQMFRNEIILFNIISTQL